MATSSRRVADELAKEYSSQKGRYYRFDTANNSGSIATSDWAKPSKVTAHATNHLSEKHDDIKKFANNLINGLSLVSEQLEELEEIQRLQEPRESESEATCLLYSYIPLHKNLKFVGRQAILSKLDDKALAQIGVQQVALVGLGGMGKPQIALKFAYTVKATYTDCFVVWLTAASIDVFRNSCKELTVALGIETSDNEDPRILVKISRATHLLPSFPAYFVPTQSDRRQEQDQDSADYLINQI